MKPLPVNTLTAAKQLVDSKELAQILGVKVGWVRQNVHRIPHHKLGRLVRYDPKAVMEHFKTQ